MRKPFKNVHLEDREGDKRVALRWILGMQVMRMLGGSDGLVLHGRILRP
jgi:hypothetical protein